jgi:hypothetical protein
MSDLSSEPLPVEPLPVEPIYPQPAARSGRPGVIGFIGVTSIVVASLAILAGVCFGLMDVGLMMASISAKQAAMTPAPVPTANIVAPGGGPERLPANGLPVAARRNMADGLSRLTALSPKQLLQLDELLAEEGTSIAPTAATFTPSQLAATVAKNGHLAFNGNSGSDYFVLGQGRLEISDDRAVFFPTDGSPALRSNAIQLPVYAVSPHRLGPDQIRSIIRTINEMNGTKIKSAQLQALIQTFQNPGQQIVVPTTDGSDPAWEITSATTDASGSLSVSTTHGNTYSSISCDASGNLGQSSVSTNSPFMNGNGPAINTTAAATALVLTVLQLLLAMFLLISGIVTLRLGPRGRMLHWIYVVLKIPLAAGTAAASAWMWGSLMNSIPNPNNATPPGVAMSMAIGMGALPAVIGGVYAIVLFFLLLGKTVRTY